MGHYSNPRPAESRATWRARAERRYERMYGRRSIADPKTLHDDLLHIATDDDPMVTVMLSILGVVVLGFAVILLSIF